MLLLETREGNNKFKVEFTLASELLLLTTGLPGDRVALHDVIALSGTGADLSCFVVDLVLFFSKSQCLKAYAVFMIRISRTFSCIYKCD